MPIYPPSTPPAGTPAGVPPGAPAGASPGAPPGAPAESARVRTAWHPLAFNLIRAFLPEHWQVYEEFPLSNLPPRIDIVVVRRGEGDFEVTGLSALFDRFRPPGRRHAIIEVKSPEDRLEPRDLSLLFGYAGFYMHREDILEPEQAFLVTLSHGLTRPWREHLEQRYGARLEEIHPGVWEVKGLMAMMYCIDTGVASQSDGNHLLYAFTRDFLQEPGGVSRLLDERERVILMDIGQRVGRWRGQPSTAFLKGYDMLDEKTQAMLEEALSKLPAKVRLAGLKPAERLEGLKPAERLEGLSRDELEALLKAVPTELLDKVRREPH